MPANRLRHWKQRFEDGAKKGFVFTRRLKLGLDKKDPWVYPGDPVPSGDVRIQGRLKRWWNAGYIALAGWKSPDELKREKRAAEVVELRDALASACEQLPSLVERVAELRTKEDVASEDLAMLEGDLASMRAFFEQVKKRGIPVEDPAILAILDTFDLPPEKPKGEGEEVKPEPEEPPAGEAPQGPAEGPEAPAGESGAGAPEAPEAPAPAQGDAPGPEALDEILVEPTGGGWFSVTVPGEDEPRKVQGEAKLRELLATLGASE